MTLHEVKLTTAERDRLVALCRSRARDKRRSADRALGDPSDTKRILFEERMREDAARYTALAEKLRAAR